MNASAELLKQLRIDRDTPPPRARRGWLIAGLALGIGLIGGLFPALRAARLPIVAALRAV